MTRTWKILPLALLAALGVFMLVPGGSPRNARADVTGLGAMTPNPVPVSGTGTFTVTAHETSGASGGSIVLTVGLGTITNMTCTISAVACTPTFSGAPGLSVTVSVADNGSGSNTETVVLTVSYQAPGTTGTNVTYGATQHSVPLSGFFDIASAGGTSTATPTVTGTPSTATPTLTPTVTGTVTSAITQIRVSATGPINCGGTSLITAVLTNANGASVPGTSVTISTNLGTVSPTTAIDQGGGILAALTAPAAQGGTATITVTAGGISGSAQVPINCVAATSVPPTAPPPVVTASVIQPPRTGDAGLLARTPAWRLSLGFALIAASLLGSLAVLRRT